MIRLKWLFVAMLAALLPALLSAQTFSGRLTSSFYAYERSDSIGVNTGQARGYQTFQFDFGGKEVRLRTYGQLDRDFSTRLAGDGKARMYNLSLEWKNLAKRVDVQLGRQPVFSGGAVGTIDGAQIKVKASRWLRLKAFGGGLLPSDQRLKLIDDLDKNYMAGGQAVLAPNPDLSVGLSFFDKRQLRPGYDALRADSIGNVLTLFVEPEDRAYRVGSVDASWFMSPKASLYARSDYDFHAEQITRAEFSTRTEFTRELMVTGNYIFRSPRLPWNSIFSAFDIEDNHEVEVGLYFHQSPNLRLYGNAARIFYDNDNSLRYTAGADFKFGGLSYVHRSGYAGFLDGVNGSIHYPLQRGMFLPSVQLSWAAYKLDAGEAERVSLFSGAAGLLVRPHKTLTFDGQLQLLHNRYYSNDVRFLFRMQYWFFTKLGASS